MHRAAEPGKRDYQECYQKRPLLPREFRAYSTPPAGGRRENHRRSIVEIFLAVMLADSKRIQSHLIGQFDLLDELAYAFSWTEVRLASSQAAPKCGRLSV
jgi:hypothetical protein